MKIKLVRVCDSGYDGETRRWMFDADPTAHTTPQTTLDDGTVMSRGARDVVGREDVPAPDGSYLGESVSGELLLFVPGCNRGFGATEVFRRVHLTLPALNR